MDVFLMIKRKKTVIFTDVKDRTTVEEVKKIVAGITKVPPENQQLYKNDRVMDPSKTLRDYGLTSCTAKAYDPAVLGLAYKDQITGEFEVVEMEPLCLPPELPEVPAPRENQSRGL